MRHADCQRVAAVIHAAGTEDSDLAIDDLIGDQILDGISALSRGQDHLPPAARHRSAGPRSVDDPIPDENRITLPAGG
jgi:hypothetical protein